MKQSTSLLESEIRKEEPMSRDTSRPRKYGRARIILALLAAVVVLGAAFAIVRARRSTAPATAASANAPTPDAGPVEITTAPAIARTQRSRSKSSVHCLPMRKLCLSSSRGELSSLNVDFGSLVRQGQVIAQIDRRDAELKLAQLRRLLIRPWRASG
jgi:multidrug efflux pump subunit AcrA (membrane-fusion protein)